VGDAGILVKVKAASLCGSDVHVYEWTPNYEWISIPVILGHEFSGEVVAIGQKVKTVSIGDRITAMPGMACSLCEYCQVGKPDLCTNRISLGLRSDGAFAEYVRLTASATILKLPDSLSFETASLCEPLSVVLRAVDISDIKVGQTAAVLGPGPIGLLALQVVKLSGASSAMVAGTSVDKKRLDIAVELGADRIVNVEREDPVKASPTGGFDFVFEASGNPRSVPQALAMVKPGGKVILIGIHPIPAEIQTTDLVRRSKSILGAYGYDADIWRRAITLLTTLKVRVEPMITHRIPLPEAERGFELAVRKEATKVIFIP
jgi:2-desacetyl-2-hydroxyethyl bacteriochlorophyllide A dehydrogenase